MRPPRGGLGSLLVVALVVASVATPGLAGGQVPAVTTAGGGEESGAAVTENGTGAENGTERGTVTENGTEAESQKTTETVTGAALSESAASAQAADDNVSVTQEFRLTPSTPGEVLVTQRYAFPDRVVSLNTSIPSDASIVSVDGFRYVASQTFRWDGATDAPSLTYRLPVNETLNGTAASGNESDLRAVDAGNWALFRRPNAPTEFTYRGPKVSFRQTGTTAGPGAVGEWLVFLGEHEVHERTAHRQRFRLVVPATANMTAAPAGVLETLASASDAFRVGDRDEEVFVVAAPATGRWGSVRGVQRGDADLWVRADEPVNDSENAWVHEYVHTRQQFDLAPELEWFREASAAYYAALFTYEQDRIGFPAFRERLARGASPRYDDTVLSNRSTWNESAGYDRGALVVGQLDRQIRLASTHNRTIQTVVRAMNGDDERTTTTDFLGLLGRAGNTSVIVSGQSYVETTANVSTWNRTTHEAAFSRPSPRVGYGLPHLSRAGAYRVTGPYRTGTVEHGEPLRFVPGERLTVNAVVTNAGGVSGNYTAQLTVNGTVVDRTNGTVAANGSTTAPLNHTFATPGRYAVGLDGDNVTVSVRRTATARLADVDVDRREVRAGESVGVRAVVENNATVPGETTLVVSRNYEAVDSRQVYLGPSESTVVTFDVPLAEPGTAVLSVGGLRPVEVEVRPPPNATATAVSNATGNGTTTTAGPGTTSDESGPGFGVAAALAALVLASLVGRLRD